MKSVRLNLPALKLWESAGNLDMAVILTRKNERLLAAFL
jgi:hypothetical protein